MSSTGRPYAPSPDADPKTLLALTHGPVDVETVIDHPVPYLRAFCRRCHWHGQTRRFSRLFTRDALALRDREELVVEMREHVCDELVMAIAEEIQRGPEVMADGLEAVIAAVLAVQDRYGHYPLTIDDFPLEGP